MTLDLPPNAQQVLAAEAADRGIPVEELAAELLVAEARRLGHIRRSRPRPRGEPRPPGRPQLTEDERRLRELARGLLAVFEKKRELLGEADFEKYFGEQLAELKRAIEVGDLQRLQWYEREQPWVRRG